MIQCPGCRIGIQFPLHGKPKSYVPCPGCDDYFLSLYDVDTIVGVEDCNCFMYLGERGQELHGGSSFLAQLDQAIAKRIRLVPVDPPPPYAVLFAKVRPRRV